VPGHDPKVRHERRRGAHLRRVQDHDDDGLMILGWLQAEKRCAVPQPKLAMHRGSLD
jgi:hypothetical protein